MKDSINLELVKAGFANGVAKTRPLTESEKQIMIQTAADAFGDFLDALQCDWRNDPNSMETPRRVAKAYFNASKNSPNALVALLIISCFSKSLRGNPGATPFANPSLTTSNSS